MTHHIGVGHGPDATFTVPNVHPSCMPAFLGSHSLSELGAIIDCRNSAMHLIGHGGYKIELNPGSQKLNMERSPTGHYMLPCSEFSSFRQHHAKSSYRDDRTTSYSVGSFFKKTTDDDLQNYNVASPKAKE